MSRLQIEKGQLWRDGLRGRIYQVIESHDVDHWMCRQVGSHGLVQVYFGNCTSMQRYFKSCKSCKGKRK